jgi:DNA polymerase V
MAKILNTDGSIKAILDVKTDVHLKRPMVGQHVPAGFPSPAQDYIEGTLDLNEHLIQHPASTFFMRADGDSMLGAGIFSGDILVVDRALEAEHNSIVVAIYDGELILKRLRIENGSYFLCSENTDFPPIVVNQELEFLIWGVVSYVIHKV